MLALATSSIPLPDKKKKVRKPRDETERRESICAEGRKMHTQPFLTFPEQEHLLHAAFGGCQIKRTFALSISVLQVSSVVYQQVDDFHTGLLHCSMKWGVQTLAEVNTGSLTKQMATTQH